jgi:hypothetical protein
LSININKSSLEGVTPTGDTHLCCGKTLKVVELHLTHPQTKQRPGRIQCMQTQWKRQGSRHSPFHLPGAGIHPGSWISSGILYIELRFARVSAVLRCASRAIRAAWRTADTLLIRSSATACADQAIRCVWDVQDTSVSHGRSLATQNNTEVAA